MDDVRLEKCPVCGDDAKYQLEMSGRWVRFFCRSCGLSSMGVPVYGWDAEKIQRLADELWNKRVEPVKTEEMQFYIAMDIPSGDIESALLGVFHSAEQAQAVCDEAERKQNENPNGMHEFEIFVWDGRFNVPAIPEYRSGGYIDFW